MTGTRDAPTGDATLDAVGSKFDEAMGRWMAQPRQVGGGKVSLRSLMRSRAEGIGQMLAQGGTYQDIVVLMAEAGIENPSRAAVAKYAAELGIGRRAIGRKGRTAGQVKARPAAPKAALNQPEPAARKTPSNPPAAAETSTVPASAEPASVEGSAGGDPQDEETQIDESPLGPKTVEREGIF